MNNRTCILVLEITYDQDAFGSPEAWDWDDLLRDEDDDDDFTDTHVLACSDALRKIPS